MSSMCCFTGPVHDVRETRIFARHQTEERQLLAYAMSVDAPAAVAMVLPVPTPADAAVDAVRFIDLSRCPTLFADLAGVFPGFAIFGGATPAGGQVRALAVERVGAFEASFVPRQADFARLDKRFRLPDALFTAMPAYRDYGFVVFRLAAGAQTVHPMAFSFPHARGLDLFFPTVHVHDGAAPPLAGFDHVLYAQRGPTGLRLADWEESPGLVGAAVDPATAPGLVDGGGHLYRLRLHGELPNRDTLVAAG